MLKNDRAQNYNAHIAPPDLEHDPKDMESVECSTHNSDYLDGDDLEHNISRSSSPTYSDLNSENEYSQRQSSVSEVNEEPTPPKKEKQSKADHKEKAAQNRERVLRNKKPKITFNPLFQQQPPQNNNNNNSHELKNDGPPSR